MSSTPRLRWIRPFTAHVFNRFARLFAGWLPGFAILTHVGRRSGRTYRTPINVFRRGDQYVFALTYGSDVDWLKNIRKAGGCAMRSRGRDVRLGAPEVFRDPAMRDMPRYVRPILRLDGVTEFVRMRELP